MGPKRKQEPKKVTHTKGISKSKQGSQSNSKKTSPKNTPIYLKQNDKMKDRNQDYNSANSPSQPSQFFLGRKNRLNDFLSSSQKDDMDRLPTEKLRTVNKKASFEEDDGFVYKRSQSVEALDPVSLKKARGNNPISQLKEEIENISNEDEDISLIDLKLTNKSKSSTSKNSPKKSKLKPNSSQSKKANNNILDDPSLQLSSPIRYTRTNGYHYPSSSDEYVEQVSYHTLSLADAENAPKGYNKPSLSKRRSSYYNRGKRVSSIGNGFEGEPHEEVPVSGYYKLVDTALPEPDRIRQLLIWCFKKKLDQEEKEQKKSTSSTEDQTVINIAKVIKEELLKDLMEKQISISWYSNLQADEESDIITSKEIIVSNPQNISNLQNIDIYSKKLKSLIKEKNEWQTAFQKSIRPILGLSVNSIAEHDDAFYEYIEKKKSELTIQDDYSLILQKNWLGQLEHDFQIIRKNISENLEPSVDKLFDISYRLKKASDLAKYLQDTKLDYKISSLLKNFVIKNRLENYIKTNTSTVWPIPKKQLTTREILRGITRLEAPKK